MPRTIALISTLLLLSTPLAAQTFRAENRVDVTGTAGGFLVANGGGQGARGMWCAAADYSKRVLGAHGTQRIYVAQALQRGAPAHFTLDPTGLTPSRVSIVSASLRTPGASLSVYHAYVFCADHRLNSR